MIYNAWTVPLRTPMYDDAGRLTRTWIDFLSNVSKKAGRSVTWRGIYSDTLEYAVNDVVGLKDGSLWIALQAQPVNGQAVTPGTDDTVWENILKATAVASGGAFDLQVNGVDVPFDLLVINGSIITVN